MIETGKVRAQRFGVESAEGYFQNIHGEGTAPYVMKGIECGTDSEFRESVPARSSDLTE